MRIERGSRRASVYRETHENHRLMRAPTRVGQSGGTHVVQCVECDPPRGNRDVPDVSDATDLASNAVRACGDEGRGGGFEEQTSHAALRRLGGVQNVDT